MRVLGWVMLVGFFVGLFVIFASREGVAVATETFMVTAALVAFILVAVWLISGEPNKPNGGGQA